MTSLRLLRNTGIMVAAATALVLPASMAVAQPATTAAPVSYAKAVPGKAPANASYADAVYLDQQGRRIAQSDAPSTSARPNTAARLGCTPGSGRDNPHYSSGDVSGHGWWTKGNCSASTAHVYNCLYEYYTDNSWRQKACSAKKQLKPYTGSGQRTVARARCNPTAGLISWRNHVDVDVDGKIDTAEKPMNQANVVCVVF